MRKLLLVSTVGLLFTGSTVLSVASYELEAREQGATNQTRGAGTAQRPGSAPTAQPTRSAADVITVIGCVQRETEYRAEMTDGKGGLAGTGVGAGNEFVLRSLQTVSNDTLKPTGTAGVRPDEVYSVTGNLEHELARAVGRQVAVSGYVEVAPSQGTEKVKDLPRLNAAGWHVVSERCAPASNRR